MLKQLKPVMRIFKNRMFTRWAAKEGLNDEILQIAVREIENGLIDADLGGYVLKKRVRLAGRGKRGAARTLLAYRFKDRAFFVYGFAKNSKSTVKDGELKALKMLAAQLLSYSDRELDKAVSNRILTEVNYDG